MTKGVSAKQWRNLFVVIAVVAVLTVVVRKYMPQDKEQESGQLIVHGEQSLLDPDMLANELRNCRLSESSNLRFTGNVISVNDNPPFKLARYGSGAREVTSDPAILKLIDFQERSKEVLWSTLVRLEPAPSDTELEYLSACVNASDKVLIASPNYPVVIGQSAKISPWDGRPFAVAPDVQFDVMRCDYSQNPNGCGLGAPELLSAGTAGTVDVAVFDTSNFQGSALQTSALPAPLDLSFQTDNGGNVTAAAGDFYDHGIFVASVIHQFAPEATVSLFRSIPDSGIGKLSEISYDLNTFITNIAASPSGGFVMNLSCNVQSTADSSTFMDHLTNAVGYGGIVVASAGNFQGTKNPIPTPLYPFKDPVPAGDPPIVVVGGADKSRSRACFSHDHSTIVLAYSGNGKSSGTTQCATIDHADAVYGLIATGNPPSGWQTVGWSGTSFAAAIISAQAAREQAQWESQDGPCQGVALPALTDRAATFKGDLQNTSNQWGTTRVANLAAMDASCH